MKSRLISRLLLILIAVLLAGLTCNAPASNPTQSISNIVVKTQTAIAISVQLTQTQAAEIPTTTLPSSPIVESPTVQVLEASQTPTIPATEQPSCQNGIKFIGETIPDNQIFSPGEAFTKTWTLQNSGSCTWTQEYSLVFIEGERMGGASPIPLSESVPPTQTVEVKVDLAAPQQPGEFQGFWKLQDPQGDQFGLGQDGSVAFWVKIMVEDEESGQLPDLGDPSWLESFDASSSMFALGADSKVNFEIKNGALVMTALVPAGDQWRIAESVYPTNFYIETQFQTGPACSGQDSYGLILHAPDQPDNIINSGYVISFACNGKVRAYRMDNGTFSSLINWTDYPTIKSGADQSNVIGVKVQGNRITVYANGVRLFDFMDSTYPAGYFGLVIRSAVTPNFRVLVHRIAFWNLP